MQRWVLLHRAHRKFGGPARWPSHWKNRVLYIDPSASGISLCWGISNEIRGFECWKANQELVEGKKRGFHKTGFRVIEKVIQEKIQVVEQCGLQVFYKASSRQPLDTPFYAKASQGYSGCEVEGLGKLFIWVQGVSVPPVALICFFSILSMLKR